MDIETFKHLKEHAELSPYHGSLKKPDVRATGENTLCGDALTFDFKLKKGTVQESKFKHQGCALSAAAASILLEYAQGKKYKTIQDLKPDTLMNLLGMPVSPARIPCVLLPLAVLNAHKKEI